MSVVENKGEAMRAVDNVASFAVHRGFSMRKKRLRDALVGAGRVSQYHLDARRRIPEADIVAIADDLNRDRAPERARVFSLHPHHTYSGLVGLLESEPDLDFVDIATRPHTHPELVQLAASPGLAVNCEKPCAVRMIRAEDDRNLR